jgi:hypothetical protein
MVPPAPFDSLGARVTGFVARADGEKLDALCRKVFTEPSGGQVDVCAVGDHVMLTWGTIERVVSMDAAFRDVGAVREPQVCIWVPVVRVTRDEGGAAVAQRFAVFLPYIWVDNAMSLATGRELFGYPKAWGWITVPDGDGPRAWGCDAFGLDFGGGEVAGRRPLLQITEGDAHDDGEDGPLEDFFDFAQDVARRLFDRHDDEVRLSFRLARDLWGDLRAHAFPHLFLKQVHDVCDGDAAALQQITEARYTVRNAHARPLLREFDLTVHPLDSHPVITELGLTSQTLRLGYELSMDFVVGGGTVVHDCLAP